MGTNTVQFPIIGTTITVGWNDVNLRIGDVSWDMTLPATVRVRIYRQDISPIPVYDEVHVGPQTGATNVPGNLRMVEYTDPLYPEEGTRLLYPDGLVMEFEVIKNVTG